MPEELLYVVAANLLREGVCTDEPDAVLTAIRLLAASDPSGSAFLDEPVRPRSADAEAG